jgi:hypothetical protein
MNGCFSTSDGCSCVILGKISEGEFSVGQILLKACKQTEEKLNYRRVQRQGVAGRSVLSAL